MFDRKEWNKQWRLDNPEYMEKWRLDHKEESSKRHKQWLKDNKEHCKEYNKQYVKNKYRTDFKFNLNSKIKRAITLSLKGNKLGRNWEDLVGYTLIDLIKRLKDTLPIGYTWQDYLQGKLVIDHIIPISVFNFTKAEHIDFKNCWNLNNLRLLPAEENLRKSNKLDKSFQSALKLIETASIKSSLGL